MNTEQMRFEWHTAEAARHLLNFWAAHQVLQAIFSGQQAWEGSPC